MVAFIRVFVYKCPVCQETFSTSDYNPSAQLFHRHTDTDGGVPIDVRMKKVKEYLA